MARRQRVGRRRASVLLPLAKPSIQADTCDGTGTAPDAEMKAVPKLKDAIMPARLILAASLFALLIACGRQTAPPGPTGPTNNGNPPAPVTVVSVRISGPSTIPPG